MVLSLTVEVVLAALVLTGIVGLVVWSITTQHRDPGCERSQLARDGSGYAAIRLATAADAEQGQPVVSEAQIAVGDWRRTA
jgi:hypothetical protein